MKFRKIVAIDDTGLIDEVKMGLKQLADEVVFYNDFPDNDKEIISRIDDADCVLVSWNTPINRVVIEACSTIRYIGMCCSLYDEKSANVDINAAREHDITVLGVKDYGDEGVIEYIISELVKLLHGFGKHQWKDETLELTDQKLGIIGLGTLGIMLAKAAKAFGMEVYYYNRTRKTDLEKDDVKYLDLDELLHKVDILSTHLPRNTQLLNAERFKLFGNGKILINTSLEPTFDVEAFTEWIGSKDNYAIFDRVAMGKYYKDLKTHENVIYTDKVAGWTRQAKGRLSFKVLRNIEKYLNENYL
ncbi:NAD(P)-dependent oxidoreductase [Alkaliphilus peptidifermentans]|uniref:Lactate dehydrogenase n=1 Tax=Alkaliphilus peptidifermentans DSM 18978 TaxID=1120976 RepID=A0A1G5FWJ1_9FIRM|nr:NAD(P)-dependent oxidoreductase [Alkaliphilus peptidifermentans]SCY43507.1 hypothetical protein SAMN03080606_01517 [Alkaliphilus peptidifermentans DSM 18978]